jgi:hypothetical protein
MLAAFVKGRVAVNKQSLRLRWMKLDRLLFVVQAGVTDRCWLLFNLIYTKLRDCSFQGLTLFLHYNNTNVSTIPFVYSFPLLNANWRGTPGPLSFLLYIEEWGGRAKLLQKCSVTAVTPFQKGACTKIIK